VTAFINRGQREKENEAPFLISEEFENARLHVALPQWASKFHNYDNEIEPVNSFVFIEYFKKRCR